MSNSIHILLIDDNPENQIVIKRLLSRSHDQHYTVTVAETGRAGLALWRTVPIDCILLDFLLPDMDGVELINEMMDEGEGRLVPVVMLTGYSTEELAIRAFKSGVHDYLSKQTLRIDVLTITIRHAMTNVATRRQTEL